MYSLIIYSSEELPPTTYDLKLATYVIGRHSTCNIVVHDRSVSRWHCTLILMPPDKRNTVPYYVIRDGLLMAETKSRNGTWVNNSQIKSAPLYHQDTITFGTHKYPKAVFINNNLNIQEDGTYTDSEQK